MFVVSFDMHMDSFTMSANCSILSVGNFEKFICVDFEVSVCYLKMFVDNFEKTMDIFKKSMDKFKMSMDSFKMSVNDFNMSM